MLFSAFTPLGLFELSNDEPIAERIYKSMVAASNGQFDLTEGESRQEAFYYMASLSAARAEKAQERAARQALSSEVNELLPVREAEFEIIPAYSATFVERRAEIVRRTVRPLLPWSAQRIVERLEELLGDDFIAYYPTPLADVSMWPASLGAQPQNLQLPSVTRKYIRITAPISVGLGSPQAVTYELLGEPAQSPDVGASIDLIVGDFVVVEPEILGITETVEVTAVTPEIVIGLTTTPATFTASFDLPHTDNCLGMTAPYPKWVSTKRHNLVIVTPTAAIDGAKRKLVNDNMRRMVRASSTWDIVQSADGLTTGAFTIGTSLIGSQTIASVTF